MPVWWKYGEVLNALNVAGTAAEHFKQELLRCLASGRVAALSDFVIYSGGSQMVREEYVTIPASYWRAPRTLFTEGKRLSFRPEINKLFNPAVSAPEGYGADHLDLWAADCFSLSYLGDDLVREFQIPVAKPATPRAEEAKPSVRGRKPDREKWRAFAAALAVVAAKGDKGGEALELGGAGSDVFDEVVRVIQARLGADADHFDISHVQGTIALAQDWMKYGVPDPMKD